MAAVLRTGLANLNSINLLGGLCKVPKNHNGSLMQVARITGKEVRVGRPPKPPPFDWRNKEYGRWAYITDRMEKRFDDNTKVIVIEGLPAMGKDKLARQLAEELEMTYVPPASFDDYHITDHGFDMRSLNHRLPVDCQFFDIESFLRDPKGRNTLATQLTLFALKTNRYIEGFLELLSSGKGIVLQRSPYTDTVFAKAMFQNDYISRPGYDLYKRILGNVLQELMHPHLIIYLDAPVSVVKENIKKRNIPYEVNSPALTEKYLEDISTVYKEQYLREASKQSHLLMYDWMRESDVSVVVEDIERLEFDNLKDDEEKFADWRHDDISKFKIRLGEYSVYREDILLHILSPEVTVPELLKTKEDDAIYDDVMMSCPDLYYGRGFNPEKDKGLLWKLRDKWENYQRPSKST